MNKTILVLVVAVLVGIGGYYYWQSAGPSGFDATKPYAISGEFGGATSTPAGSWQSLSLKDLLDSGTAQKCAIKAGTTGAGVEGTIYVAAGQVRGDFSADSAVGKTGAHLVVKNGSTYSWVDGFKAGVKSPVTASSTTADGGG
ncbi:MAG: hypothetical protein Q7T49_00620, partial [bacterium]|nr:hypothetical protein [bacterium]